MPKEGWNWKSKQSLILFLSWQLTIDSEKEELDLQLRTIPEIERRIAELTS